MKEKMIKGFKLIAMLCFVVMFIFSFAGMVLIGNIFHELSHRDDLNDIAEDGMLCFFEAPNDFNLLRWNEVAYYNFRLNKSVINVTERYNEIAKTTEIRAYFKDSIVSLVFIFSLFVIALYLIINYFDKKYLKEQLYLMEVIN